MASLERTRHALAVADYKHVLDVAGIPLPEVNVWVEGVLVDAGWRDRKVIVELDGRDNHSSWAQIQRDCSNELRLRAADFEVRRYGFVQLEDEPTLVETDLLRALGVPR